MSAVTLHPVRRADGPDLVQAHLDSRDHHGPWVQPFTTLDGFHGWYGEQVTGANASFIACEGTSDRIVGVTTLSQIFLKGFQNAYLSYHGMVTFAGRGLMTTAVRLTIDQAFNNIGLHRLEANIQPNNHRSIALVKRLGFRKEGFSPRYLQIDGVWCDHERWALLADEPYA